MKCCAFPEDRQAQRNGDLAVANVAHEGRDDAFGVADMGSGECITAMLKRLYEEMARMGKKCV